MSPAQQKEALDLVKRLARNPVPGADCEAWVKANLSGATDRPMADRHRSLYKWFGAFRKGEPNDDRLEVWPRGGGKSTVVETGIVYVGQAGTRQLVMIVCDTQDQANKHVQSIRKHFESLKVTPRITNYGQQVGWRVDMLMCANGFGVIGYGIDSSIRGIKIEDVRPDLVVADDIDNREDGKAEIERKIRTLTDSILPSGSTHCTCLVVQNVIHDRSIVNQLLSDQRPFISSRVLGTCEPAVRNMVIEEYRQPDGTYIPRIISGTPTWSGQNLAVCNRQLDQIGLRAFMREMQHEVKGETPEALWTRAIIERSRLPIHECPAWREFRKIVVALDIAVSTGEQSDQTAITVGGVTNDWHFYIFQSICGRWKPEEWARLSVGFFKQYRARCVAVEKNQGGLLIQTAINTVERVPVSLIHVHQAKEIRAEAPSILYEMGRVHHLGVLADLEDEQVSWSPGSGKPSPNLIDSLVILLMELDPRIVKGDLSVYNRFAPVQQAPKVRGLVDEYEPEDYEKDWPKTG